MKTPESYPWFDTETQAELGEVAPQKLAPPTTSGYSLVLLEKGLVWPRVRRILKVLSTREVSAPVKCPWVVAAGLSLAEARYGQFELICTDSISVFLLDSVLENAHPLYLDDLFPTLFRSPEFEKVEVEILSVPDSERGRLYLEQFLGEHAALPVSKVMARKKARIMQHWGGKLNANVRIHE